MRSPFAASSARPGHGEITLSIQPPHAPRLTACSYQYPLKLIAPDAQLADDGALVHTVYLLSYGGGLVAGDAIHLDIHLDSDTRLALLTQGSTKIFISPSPDVITRQHLHFSLSAGSALCYIPDPTQPFARSAFEQTQVYTLPSLQGANLCVCDWVCKGRAARGENWNFYRYCSKNEVWLQPSDGGEKRLLLRDNLILEDGTGTGSFADRFDHLGVYGTLILYGLMFAGLGQFFMREFEAMPRIGARKWDDEPEGLGHGKDSVEAWRKARGVQETEDKVLWTAASVRGFVLVRFAAREAESIDRWLLGMLQRDGTVERLFGERALLSLQ